jgi:hypothetical protein
VSHLDGAVQRTRILKPGNVNLNRQGKLAGAASGYLEGERPSMAVGAGNWRSGWPNSRTLAIDLNRYLFRGQVDALGADHDRHIERPRYRWSFTDALDAHHNGTRWVGR